MVVFLPYSTKLAQDQMNENDTSGWGGSLAVVGVAGFAALCCVGSLVAGTVGLGAVAAALTSRWLLIPVGLAGAGIAIWYTWRRSRRVRGVAPIPNFPSPSRSAR